MERSKMNGDRPIQSIKEDRLGRDTLAQIVADSLRDRMKQPGASICYGLYGKWGEGKTSLINLIVDHPQDDCQGNIVHFNPWMVGDQKSLLAEFFTILAGDLEGDVKSWFQQYGALISYGADCLVSLGLTASGFGLVALPIVSPFFSVLKGIKKWIRKTSDALQNMGDRPLTERKKEISEALKREDQHLLVIIDDIDRLDRDEIRAVFRLIRQVADFDNIVYLVAFDPEIVAKELSDVYGDNNLKDGFDFINKIVQIPIMIPKVDDEIFFRYFDKEFQSLLDELGVQYDSEKMSQTSGILSNLLHTPRKLKDFLNQFRVVISLFRDELSLYDLAILEAIKMRSLPVYNAIYLKRNALLLHVNYVSFYKDNVKENAEVENRYKEAIQSILNEVNIEDRSAFNGTLKTLFPDSRQIGRKMVEDQRLQTDLFFPLYFALTLPSGMMSKTEFDKLLDQIDDYSPEDIAVWINKKREEYSFNEVNRAFQYIFYRTYRLKDYQTVDQRCLKICRGISLSVKDVDYLEGVKPNEYNVNAFIYSYLNDYARLRPSLDHEPIQDWDGISSYLTEVYEKMNVYYSLDLNNTLYSEHFYDGRRDYEFFKPLVKKYTALSSKDQTLPRGVLLRSFFEVWKDQDEKGPIDFLSDKINDDDFDMSVFLKKMIPEDNMQDINIDRFMVTFQDVSRSLLAHMNGKPNLDTRTKTILASIRDYIDKPSI